ncbi:MAG: thioredoxin family protein [Candidatus Marinimicrobia bacterium]|nr:thioredoxin family protein [Candidatus Neomarinimicrobiota bacterium]
MKKVFNTTPRTPLQTRVVKEHGISKIEYLLTLFILFGTILFSQTPQLTKDETTGDPMLIGLSQRIDYENRDHFKVWFNEEFENYEIDEETLSILSEVGSEITLECFMGTWCSDSRREVPRMYKILDQITFDETKLKIVSVDRKMVSPEGEQKGKNIHHVPTLIFYKEGKEIGRIIESPVGTLEEDFVDILFGNPPTPNYADWEEKK